MNPQQPPHPPSAGGPWSQPGPFAPPARPSKPGPAVTILLILGALLVGGVFGSGSGAVAAYVTTQPDGPTAPPSMSPEFPDAARRYLPDLKVADLADAWLVKANGWKCAPSDSRNRISGAKNQLNCDPVQDGFSSTSARIEYDGDTQIQYVSVRCGFKPGANYCKSLFANLGDALFRQPELAEQAAAWAGKNVDGDNINTTIGRVRLAVDLGSHSITAMPVA